MSLGSPRPEARLVTSPRPEVTSKAKVSEEERGVRAWECQLVTTLIHATCLTTSSWSLLEFMTSTSLHSS